MIKKFRDISIIDFNGSQISIACDSCSGVGELTSDIIKSDGFYTGYRTAFVPLAETLALGAVPLTVINTLSVSFDGYGKQLIEGISTAAKEAGLSGNDVITGSTEENFILPVTSIGITVIGELSRELPVPLKNECHLYLVGLPFLGEEVLMHKNDILDFKTIHGLLESNDAYDILPVGSKGIYHEINEMAEILKSNFIDAADHGIDLKKSAGPATCAIVAFNSSTKFPDFKIPVIKLGSLFPK